MNLRWIVRQARGIEEQVLQRWDGYKWEDVPTVNGKEQEEPELLPCPFCGSIDVGHDKNIEDQLDRIICNHCEASMVGVSKHNAKEDWNKREWRSYG